MSQVPSAFSQASLGDDKPSKQTNFIIASDKSTKLDRFTDQFSEWCSSILVKETRQAVKSRQFFWSYVVLLVAVATWTAIGMIAEGSDRAQILLSGYLVILGFPLGIVIPFSAYRSVAREFEDGTIQLISITTMKPYQIVIGKFGSALLQILIYLSILAPCILFTYMLRGVDLMTLIFALVICIGGSVSLTILGLFLGGAIRSRTLGIGISLLLALALGFSYFLFCILISELSYMGIQSGLQESEAQAAMLGAFGCVFSTAALLLVAAASQISFASDNRSTPVRIMMLVQQVVFVAFVVSMLGLVGFNIEEFLVVMAFVFGHYWLLMGCLMMGESDQLSKRVQRTLPSSAFARTFFSLLMPGPGRGFLFAIGNVWACSLMFVMIGVGVDFLVNEQAMQASRQAMGLGTRKISFDIEGVVAIAISAFFVTAFLSINFILTRWTLRNAKDWPVGMGPFASLVSGALIWALTSIFTAVIDAGLSNFLGNDVYFALGANWYYMTIQTVEGRTNLAFLWFFLFMLVAMGVILTAIILASKNLVFRRTLTPDRVLAERTSNKVRQLPKGESIDEIFGELNRKNPKASQLDLDPVTKFQ